jgi:copper homeostasis protein
MLELACFSVEAANIAQSAGADRIELCQDYSAGGLTPSFSDLVRVRNLVTKPVYVMIRPRAGDFVYTSEEFAQMQQHVEEFKSLANGFVFGILTTDGGMDLARNASLVRHAHPLPCTFHRAFDAIKHKSEALPDIAMAGFTTVLSSGGERDALAGATSLAELTPIARQFGVDIMPGGGIRSSNIREIKEKTCATWLHSAAVQEGHLPDEVEVASMREMSREFC